MTLTEINNKIKSFTNLLVDQVVDKKVIDIKAIDSIAKLRRDYIKQSLPLTKIEDIISTINDCESVIEEKELNKYLFKVLKDDIKMLEKELEQRYLKDDILS